MDVTLYGVPSLFLNSAKNSGKTKFTRRGGKLSTVKGISKVPWRLTAQSAYNLFAYVFVLIVFLGTQFWDNALTRFIKASIDWSIINLNYTLKNQNI